MLLLTLNGIVKINKKTPDLSGVFRKSTILKIGKNLNYALNGYF